MARKNNSEKKTAQDPRDAEAYYQRALSLIDEGQLQAAVEEFDRAIDLDPQHGQAFLQRGLALRKQGEIEKAVEDFTQAIETLSDSADKAAAHYNRSIAYSSQGRMEKAYADIDQATALNPQLATKYSVLGIANPHAEAVEGADQDKKSAFVTTSEGESSEVSPDSDPQELEQVEAVDEVLEQESEPDVEAISLQEASQSAQPLEGETEEKPPPEESVEAEPQDAKIYFDEGLAHYSKGEYEQAALEFNKAVSIDKKYAAAYYNQGNAYYEMGELDRAIASYNQAVSYFTADSDKADAYYNRARTYYDKGQLEKAIIEYGKAIDLFTGSNDQAKSYNNRGLAYYEHALYKQAIADYIEGIKYATDDGILSILHRNRANALIAVNRLQDALLDCQKALELQPENPNTYIRLGKVYYKLGEHEKAIDSYQQAERLLSSPTEFNLEIARSRLCLEQTEVALTEIRAALAKEQEPGYLESALEEYLNLEQDQPRLPGLNQAIDLIQAACTSDSD